MSHYGLLDQLQEDALHGPRLLNIEEKNFKRLTKRLLAVKSPIASFNKAVIGLKPGDTDGIDSEDDHQQKAAKVQQWTEDMFLDFAQFDNNIIRAQLLLNSNMRERERYAEEKLRIKETAQTVKDNNATLHEQLNEAQRMLEARKSYDKLTEKITTNKALRPRNEQRLHLEKLKSEIADLEAESRDYARTWTERREQFGRIVDEGTQLLRLIRDEKEEAERKEGMDEDSESRAMTPGGGSTPGHVAASAEHTLPSNGTKLHVQTIPSATVPVHQAILESQTVAPSHGQSISTDTESLMDEGQGDDNIQVQLNSEPEDTAGTLNSLNDGTREDVEMT